MGFKQMDSKGYGGYARIWSIENKGKYSLANISTSKKVKDEDRYETDFQDGYVRLIGSAHDKAQEIFLKVAFLFKLSHVMCKILTILIIRLNTQIILFTHLMYVRVKRLIN